MPIRGTGRARRWSKEIYVQYGRKKDHPPTQDAELTIGLDNKTESGHPTFLCQANHHVQARPPIWAHHSAPPDHVSTSIHLISLLLFERSIYSGDFWFSLFSSEAMLTSHNDRHRIRRETSQLLSHAMVTVFVQSKHRKPQAEAQAPCTATPMASARSILPFQNIVSSAGDAGFRPYQSDLPQVAASL